MPLDCTYRISLEIEHNGSVFEGSLKYQSSQKGQFCLTVEMPLDGSYRISLEIVYWFGPCWLPER